MKMTVEQEQYLESISEDLHKWLTAHGWLETNPNTPVHELKKIVEANA